MHSRFLLLAWAPHRRVEAERLMSQRGWWLRAEGRDWALLTPGAAVASDADLGATMVGVVFPRVPADPLKRRGPQPTHRAERLLDQVWGGYIAVFDDADHVEILRDPSGAAPAYWLCEDDLTVVGSDIETFVEMGLLRPRLDWSAIGAMMAYPQVRAARTGLDQVHELLPGQLLNVRTGRPQGAILAWSPWRFTSSDVAILDRDAAKAALEATIRSSVSAWAGQYSKILLELSGGLDSSIIAASLRVSGHAVDCVNIVTPTAEGDERRFAQLAAEGHRLHERPVTPQGVDIRRARRGRLARPGAHALLRPIEAAFVETARAVGADAFFSGLGGDNVFCSLSSAAPASDALLTAGPGRRFFTALGDLSHLHACTTWTAGQLAVRKAFRSGSMGRLPADTSFLAAGSTPARPPRHPWMTAPTFALPGKHDHIRSLLLAQAYLDRYEHVTEGPVVYPLLSQPIVELCLRIPTWLWIANGQNRAMARDAFSAVLPEAIVRRRSKGGLNAFVAAVFEDNLAALGDQLIGGRLDTAGLLDAPSICAVLANPGAAPGKALFRLLQLADVEAWARTWDPS